MRSRHRRAQAAGASLAAVGLAPLCLAACGGGSNTQSTAEAPAIQGLPVKATVSPSSGTPNTDFTVHFVAREPTGRAGQVRRSYVVTARGPSREACVVKASAQSEGTPPGATVEVTLSPAQQEGRVWCPGRYRGRVSITTAFACPAKGRCHVPPGFPTRSKDVGDVAFRVTG